MSIGVAIGAIRLDQSLHLKLQGLVWWELNQITFFWATFSKFNNIYFSYNSYGYVHNESSKDTFWLIVSLSLLLAYY